MAQTVRCDVCEERVARYLLTNLDNGDGVALCQECWVQFVSAAADIVGGSTEPEPVTDGEEEIVEDAGELIPFPPSSVGTFPPGEAEEDTSDSGGVYSRPGGEETTDGDGD
jgi:hypothetical protein